jgi:hypothetical protein
MRSLFNSESAYFVDAAYGGFMKATYEKPTLVLRERLAMIVAASASSSPP